MHSTCQRLSCQYSDTINKQRTALQFVLDWLNGKPTPKGWVIGHGTKEVRAVVEEALR